MALREREPGRIEDGAGRMPEGGTVEPKALRTGTVAERTLGRDVQVPGVPPRPQPAGILAGTDNPRLVDAGLGEHDRRRHVVAALRRVGRQGGNRRPVVRRRPVQVETRGEVEPAGQEHVTGHRVVAAVGLDRSHQGIAVAPRRQHRQVLADPDARGLRVDRPELAPHGVGRVGLEVEAVLLGEAAGQEDEDDRRGRRP